MKMVSSWIAAFAFSASVFGQQTAQEAYAQGMRAFSAGNVDEAKALIGQALELDPGHQGANAVMRRIEIDEQQRGSLEKRLSTVIIESVDFKDTSLSAILEYLPKVVADAGGPPLNIVRVFPTGFAETKKVDLTLSNVPLPELLRYLAQVSGIDLEYERHAIVVTAPSAESAN